MDGVSAYHCTMDTLTLRTPDDWHLHLRDGAALHSVVAASARQFGRAIIMPNLRPPITTVAEATAYRDRIRLALDEAVGRGEISQAQAASFQPLMTLYLTEKTSVDDIRQAAAGDVVTAVKLYPAGATTNSDAGVRAIDRVIPVLEAMAEAGMPLLVHGEVTDPDVDVFDREAVFIDRVMIPLRTRLPQLKVVFEHITTRQAAEYVRTDSAEPGMLGATITPQHLLYNRNAIFTGGLRPHWYHALELYAWAFEAAGALDKLDAFASLHGARFYGRAPNTGTITLKRQDWTIPESLPFAGTEIVPLAAGETLSWQVVGEGRTA